LEHTVSYPKPTVAICIPTYNRAEFIGGAIRSALDQNYRPIEIWISDDASTDGTDSVVKEFLGCSTPVNYFKQPVNCGIARNNNWLLSQPRTEYIVRLDSDDLLEPGYVTTLLELLQAYPQAGYAHCAVYEIDQFGHPSRSRRLFRSAAYEDAESALGHANKGYRVAANLCMYRARILHEVGFYREMDFAEDWDLSVRIADAGWGNVYSPAILAKYRAWNDEGNTRLRRKKQELLGIESVLRDSLRKAYERRGWPSAPLHHAMRRFALAHTECLSWSCFSKDEKRELQSILYRLGGSSRVVSAKCWMMRHGFSSIFRVKRSLATLAKDKAKSVVTFLRSA
jgi:glycosyltransferase involved in cell wall biosynthesis